MRRAVNIGLIRKNASYAGKNQCIYSLCRNIEHGVRADGLTDTQKEYLYKMHSIFMGEEFTVEDCREALSIMPSRAHFHISTFEEREIIRQTGRTGQAKRYCLQVTPQSHPDCFPKMNAMAECSVIPAAPMDMQVEEAG